MYTNNTVYYPQDELTTMLVPVTTGCPYDRCVFCSMYKGDKYTQVPLSEIEFELMHGYEYTEKIFLTGADPLAIGFERMEKILKLVNKHLPYCARCACYASVRSVSKYSVNELSRLHNLGLRLLYIGFESGDDDVLKFINKGHKVEDAIREAKKLNEAHLPFNAIVMYGIAGKGNCNKNAVNTARMLNRFIENKVITMNLTMFDGTPISKMAEEGKFLIPDNRERIEEVRTLLSNLEPLESTCFDTTHPTNILKIKGIIPEEKEKLLESID